MSGTNERRVTQVLNRLLVALRYSLASYLRYARPWAHAGNARLLEAVRRITADHEAHVGRLGALILKRRGRVELAQFPTRFTAYNYLALDYLAPRLIEHQRGLIEEIARCIAGLGGDPEARRLAEDILAREKRHYRTLAGLVSPSSPGRAPQSVPAAAA
jgi:hypothetical protein